MPADCCYTYGNKGLSISAPSFSLCNSKLRSMYAAGTASAKAKLYQGVPLIQQPHRDTRCLCGNKIDLRNHSHAIRRINGTLQVLSEFRNGTLGAISGVKCIRCMVHPGSGRELSPSGISLEEGRVSYQILMDHRRWRLKNLHGMNPFGNMPSAQSEDERIYLDNGLSR